MLGVLGLDSGDPCGSLPTEDILWSHAVGMEGAAFSLENSSLGLQGSSLSSRLDESKSLKRALLISINHVESPGISLISSIVACHSCCNTSLSSRK